MEKLFTPLVLVGLLLSLSSWAGTPITEKNLVGTYLLNGKVGSRKATFRMSIQEKTFSLYRIFDDGHTSQTCTGKYQISDQPSDQESELLDRVLDGLGSCPDKPREDLDFALNFRQNSIEDLTAGTFVLLTSSMASSYTLYVKMRREP